MDRIKVCDNFYLDEFLNRNTYNRFKGRATRYCYQMFAPAQLFRNLVGKSVTICNWFGGGNYNESGLRDFKTGTGASYSMHKFGGAIDCKVKDMSSHQMADVVKANWQEFYDAGIRRIEDPNDTESKWGAKGRDWLHMDTGEQYQLKGGIFVPRTDLIIVNP